MFQNENTLCCCRCTVNLGECSGVMCDDSVRVIKLQSEIMLQVFFYIYISAVLIFLSVDCNFSFSFFTFHIKEKATAV